MSGPLVPSNPHPGFAQQGSVDWIALSNTSVHFSVAVLSRLSKAGIDPFTLQVGRAICYNFALEPNAQERISDAIYKIKRYGSYGDLIWFGFGIREVVTDLADTEEGLTLVALCAALSTTYDSLFAAEVLRELCVLCHAPESFRPAFRQWKALLELCAGILTASHFVNVADGFRRLISGYYQRPQSIEMRRSPTTCTALAEAILTLARVSKRHHVSATLLGGLDCAWLAAFAEWTLSLDVEICEPEGHPIFRSRSIGSNGFAQVTIVLAESEAAPWGSLVKSKASVIPNGRSLLSTDPAFHATSLLNWHGTWSTILHDVFHDSIDTLLGPDIRNHFVIYLAYISLLRRDDLRGSEYYEPKRRLNTSWTNHPVNPLLWAHLDCTPTAFLQFAVGRLPELASCLGDLALKRIEGWDLEVAMSYGDRALQAIQTSCPCSYHSESKNQDAHNNQGAVVCLQVLTETIVLFLWILADSDIDEDIRPSITGLTNLYTWQSSANKSASPKNALFFQLIMNCDFPVLGIDLIFHVFTGLPITGAPPKYERLPTIDRLARAGNGLCIYHCALEDPSLSPESLFRVRIVRGSLYHAGFQYRELTGFREPGPIRGLGFEAFHGEPSFKLAQMIVKETADEARIEMAYLLCYLDRNGLQAKCWLHLPYIFRKLQLLLRGAVCTGECAALSSSQDEGSEPYYSITGWRVSKASVDTAKDTLDGVQPRSWKVIVSNSLKVSSVIVDQPMLLYSMLSSDVIEVFPFTSCIKCVICAGDPEPHLWMNKKTHLMEMLLTSGGEQVVLKWDSRQRGHE